MTGVLIEDGRVKSEAKEEGHVNMKTEIGIMQLQAKESYLSEARKRQERILSLLSESKVLLTP